MKKCYDIVRLMIEKSRYMSVNGCMKLVLKHLSLNIISFKLSLCTSHYSAELPNHVDVYEQTQGQGIL